MGTATVATERVGPTVKSTSMLDRECDIYVYIYIYIYRERESEREKVGAEHRRGGGGQRRPDSEVSERALRREVGQPRVEPCLCLREKTCAVRIPSRIPHYIHEARI